MRNDNDALRAKKTRIEVPIEDQVIEPAATQSNAVEETQPNAGESPSERPNEDDAIRAFVDRLKRMQAEFDNYKKRTARDAASLQERALNQALIDFLPLYDSLERACSAHSAEDEPAALYEGFLQIRNQFEQLLHAYDIERIPTIGEAFDPAIHEAILTVTSDETRSTVVEEIIPGYARGGRTLRPSQVSVSQGPVSHQEEDK